MNISDDELLLYYYRELDADAHARIGAALASQPELARRLHALVARLDAAAAMPEVPVPEHFQKRWQAALDNAATSKRAVPAKRPFFRQPMWLAAAATLAAVALIFTLMKPPVPEHVVENTATPTTPEATGKDATLAYERGLKVHLETTERELANLGDATPEERARLIQTIIGQNRIYALAAERAGEPQLARVLRAFTPVLEDLAKGREQSAANSISQLSFELRVMQARLGPGAATSNIL